MPPEVPVDVSRLAPLPYHDAVVRYLQAEEPEVWQWAESAQARQDHAQAVRAQLLKHTYRLDREGHPGLHAHCDAAMQRLGLHLPVTLYQASDGSEGGMNAALFHLPGEAHIVFTGAVLERLQGAELEALLGHELAHHRLWELRGGLYHTADRVLGSVIEDERASPSQRQTARRYRLYTEVYADRGGCVACAGLAPAVTALVKAQTGLAEVSAAAYLRQSDEICLPGVQADGNSHPEVFVRARALRLWAEGDATADAWLARTLEGPLALDTLDLPGQQQLSAWTRRLLLHWLQRPCLRSAATLAHARSFFADLRADEAPGAPLDAAWVQDSPGVHEYLACLLLDLAAVDPDLDEVPLAAALELAARLGLQDRFEPLALKELGLNKRRFNRIKREAASLLQKADAQAAADAPHG